MAKNRSGGSLDRLSSSGQLTSPISICLIKEKNAMLYWCGLMEIFRKRKWIFLVISSIIVVLGLLAVFSLTGILKESITLLRAITVEAI